MKPLILFDIDLTLYDSLLFRKLYPPLITHALNISINELTITQKEYLNTLEKSTDFKPEDYLNHISKKHSYPYKKLYRIYFDRKLFLHCLYPDTVPALEKLKNQFTLGTFSEGQLDFQLKKLQYTQIYKYFSPEYIFILGRKISSDILNSLPPQTTIIDDRSDVIGQLKTFENINPVWINRNSDLTESTVKTIHSLLDLD